MVLRHLILAIGACATSVYSLARIGVEGDVRGRSAALAVIDAQASDPRNVAILEEDLAGAISYGATD
ncbi:hypothetical protein LJR219_004343 [Phenylobacterium sp. LjRoot219]|uniref:hypothetical protein n=1 Tax=Phenylobacterium sp. LjRoot219 TaxID=3342283 RepID=UPI003ED0279A